MKKIFKLLPVFLLSLFAVSCEEYEAGSDFVQDLDLIAFVQYSSNTYTVTEDAQFYDVRVQATSVSNVDRTINITYTFDANNLTN